MKDDFQHSSNVTMYENILPIHLVDLKGYFEHFTNTGHDSIVLSQFID